MIENRLRIERQVFMGRQETKKSQEPTIPNPQTVQGLGGGRGDGSVDEGGTMSGGDIDRSQVSVWACKVLQFRFGVRSVHL